MGTAVPTDIWETVPLPDGATLRQLPAFSGQVCDYHRLHLPFMKCGQPAQFLLTKANGDETPLCTQHAEELRRRFDASSEDAPREDGTYGWIDDGLNLGAANILAREVDHESTPSAQTVDQPDLFAGGESGGGGAGAGFTDAAAPMTEAETNPESFTDSLPAEAPDDGASYGSESSGGDASSDAGSSDSGSSDSGSSDSGSGDA